MKHGFSLVLTQYLEAAEVDYDDCRSFQIVCPNCYEAVFKAGSDPDGRQYLSHYASSASNVPECELRVASTSAQTMTERNAESHGQHLALFQQRFVDLLSEQFFPDAARRGIATAHVAKMIARPSYREFVRDVRNGLARIVVSEDSTAALIDAEQGYAGQSPFWRRRQMHYARSFVKHVAAPNSLRTLYFAIAMGILHQSAVAMRRGTSGMHADEGVQMMDMLMGASEADLKRYLKELGAARGNPSPMSIMRATAMHALRAALIEFPYVEAIRTAVR